MGIEHRWSRPLMVSCSSRSGRTPSTAICSANRASSRTLGGTEPNAATGAIIALKVIALWLLILVFAIANGALREGVLLKLLARSSAFTLSGLLLITCIFLVAVFSIQWLGKLTVTQYLLVGSLWLALTLVFEFGFGLLVRGQALASLLEAYRFKDGNIWAIVLAVVAFAPVIAAIARGLVSFGGSR